MNGLSERKDEEVEAVAGAEEEGVDDGDEGRKRTFRGSKNARAEVVQFEAGAVKEADEESPPLPPISFSFVIGSLCVGNSA